MIQPEVYDVYAERSFWGFILNVFGIDKPYFKTVYEDGIPYMDTLEVIGLTLDGIIYEKLDATIGAMTLRDLELFWKKV